MSGLHAHVTDQQRGPLVKALSKLREALCHCHDAVDHIRLALYTFPDTVSKAFICEFQNLGVSEEL